MNSGLLEQDEAGEMELDLFCQNEFAQHVLAAEPPAPAAPYVLFLHPALPERAQGGVVKRKAGCNLPQMIVMGR
jgi:hypothetical protein